MSNCPLVPQRHFPACGAGRAPNLATFVTRTKSEHLSHRPVNTPKVRGTSTFVVCPSKRPALFPAPPAPHHHPHSICLFAICSTTTLCRPRSAYQLGSGNTHQAAAPAAHFEAHIRSLSATRRTSQFIPHQQTSRKEDLDAQSHYGWRRRTGERLLLPAFRGAACRSPQDEHPQEPHRAIL